MSLLTILIPACISSSAAFLMMYSAYKLNKQGDNIQPCAEQACANSFQYLLVLQTCIEYLLFVRLFQALGTQQWTRQIKTLTINKRPLEASEEILFREHMFEANKTKAWDGWCLDGVVVCVQILVSMYSGSVPPLCSICKLVVPAVWCHQISVSLKASVGAECSAWYQVLGGDQSLAVGSLNQDVKGKKQPDACLTNAQTTFSFKSVSSMDRSDVEGREEPSLSSI